MCTVLRVLSTTMQGHAERVLAAKQHLAFFVPSVVVSLSFSLSLSLSLSFSLSPSFSFSLSLSLSLSSGAEMHYGQKSFLWVY